MENLEISPRMEELLNAALQVMQGSSAEVKKVLQLMQSSVQASESLNYFAGDVVASPAQEFSSWVKRLGFNLESPEDVKAPECFNKTLKKASDLCNRGIITKVDFYLIAIGEINDPEQILTVSSLSGFLKKSVPDEGFSSIGTYLNNFAQSRILVKIPSTEGRKGVQFGRGNKFDEAYLASKKKFEMLADISEGKTEFTARVKDPEEREIRQAYELVCLGEVKRMDFYALVASQMFSRADSFTAKDMQQHLLETIPEQKDLYSNLHVFLSNMCDGKDILSVKDSSEASCRKRSYQRGQNFDEALTKIKPLLLVKKSSGFERLAVC